LRSPALELSVAYAHVRNGDCQQRCSTSVAGRATGVRPVRIAVVIVVLALSGLTAVGIGSGASSRQRTVPCSETIDITRFPYLGSNRPQERYRLVLGVISAPRAFFRQVVFGNGYANWPYFFKAGMVIRGGGKGVVVSVPRAWRNRGAIAWGNGGNGVFDTLRFVGCPGFRTKGLAYAGGFYLRSAPACLPLVFRVGHRAATVRFGLGRRCN
jgi:hypothetical protein